MTPGNERPPGRGPRAGWFPGGWLARLRRGGWRHPIPGLSTPDTGWWPLEGCEQLLCPDVTDPPGHNDPDGSDLTVDAAAGTNRAGCSIGAAGQHDIHRATELINQWAESLDLDDTGEPAASEIDSALDALCALLQLREKQAPHTDLAHAVRRARREGCAWTLIAITLGITTDHARALFG